MDRLPGDLWYGSQRHHGIGTFLIPAVVEQASFTSKGTYQALKSCPDLWKVCNFSSEQWVYIDDLRTQVYNGRLGQIVRKQKKIQKGKRYEVAVDDMAGEPYKINVQGRSLTRTPACRKVSLPAKNLYAISCPVAAVRLHCVGEASVRNGGSCESFELSYMGMKGTHSISQVYLPKGLARFNGSKGDVEVLSKAGFALCLREVEPRRELAPRSQLLSFEESRQWTCVIAGMIIPMYKRDANRMPSVDNMDMVANGPQVASRVDGSNLSLEEMKVCAEFCFFLKNQLIGQGRLSDSALCEELNRRLGDLSARDVIHRVDDPMPDVPVRINPSDAADIASEQVSSWISHNASAGHLPDPPELDLMERERILLIKFTRSPSEFEDALHHGRDLEPVRAAMGAAECPCRLASGASVFLPPECYSAVMRSLNTLTLRRKHVIIADTYVPLLVEAVRKLPSRSNVRMRTTQEVAIGETNQVGFANVFVVERTFYCEPNMLRSSASVVQSTTEARGIINPRRVSQV